MRRVLIGGLAGVAGVAVSTLIDHFAFHIPELGRYVFFAVALGIYAEADRRGFIPGPYEKTMSDLLHKRPDDED